MVLWGSAACKQGWFALGLALALGEILFGLGVV